MLDAITGYFLTLKAGWLFVALFASSYVENVFPPIPGDTVTVFAAYLVGRSQARLVEVLLATTAGSIAGFMTLYAVGRLLGMDYLLARDYRFLPASRISKAGRWFERYGIWVVLSNRFLSGVRSVISLVAGIYRLPWPKVLAAAAAGCLVWNSALIWAGYELGSNWRAVGGLLSRYNTVLLILAPALVLAWLLIRKVYGRQGGPKQQ
jgi:membrane protein DedA with SNARE-associated domain